MDALSVVTWCRGWGIRVDFVGIFPKREFLPGIHVHLTVLGFRI